MIDIEELKNLLETARHLHTQISPFVHKLEKAIPVLESQINLIKEEKDHQLERFQLQINELTSQLQKFGLPEISRREKETEEIVKLLESNDWPIAVEPECICRTEDDEKIRAHGIINNWIIETLNDLKFLDFGCGSGLTIPEAEKRGARLALGFDIDLTKRKIDQSKITDDFLKIQSQGPFDVILLDDTLDHLQHTGPIEILLQLKNISANTGKIYIRNHPWSARHGGHVYSQKNKAFLHLVLNEEELWKIGGWRMDSNLRVVTPIETYRHWFDQAGFEITKEFALKQQVPKFFLKPSFILDRLKPHWKTTSEMIRNMEINFVEYIIEHKPNSLL